MRALLAFHTEAPKLVRDAVGQIQSRSYRYTTLDALLDDVEPLLLKFDLLWTAKVVLQDGQAAALYRMEHVPSGECDEWVGPLPCVGPGPQNLGSAITYMRRYTLQAYLNLAPGDDDDGAAASAQNGSQPAANNGPGPSQPTSAPPKQSERPASAAQKRLLNVRAPEAGLGAGDFANVMLVAAGEPPRVWRTEEHADQTLKRLLDRLPAKLVDAVLEGIAKAQMKGRD